MPSSKRPFFRSIGLWCVIVFSGSVFSGCAAIETRPEQNAFDKIPNLHVTEDISYPDSPLNSYVQKAFAVDNAINPEFNFIQSLDIGNDALLARIHWIRRAQKAIYIQTFIWSNDETGRFVANELIAAAKRGVKVKIINDQWRLDDAHHLAAYLDDAHSNIEVKHYNPAVDRIKPSMIGILTELTLNFRGFNQRMHNKIFIVDDRVAITGGRNYENDYYDRGETRNFKDRDAMIIGPVVRDMTKSFMLYWAFKLSVPSEDLIDVGQLIKDKSYKNRDTSHFLKKWDVSLFSDLDREADDADVIRTRLADHLFRVQDVRFVFDPPGKNDSRGLSGGSETAQSVLDFFSEAENEIIIQTPYLVLDKNKYKAMKRLRRKNPDLNVMISSNSLAATDSVYAYAYSYKQKRLFIKNLKFRIFEMKPVPGDILKMMPGYAPTGPLKTYDVGQLAKDGGLDKRAIHLIPTVAKNVSNSIFKDDVTMETDRKHMCVHAKTYVIDGRSVWVGSYNFDPRSANLNTEVGLIIRDEEFAAAVRENILRDMEPQNSWTIGKRKDVVLVSQLRDVLQAAFESIPLIDLWPLRYTASFELKDGGTVVPFYDEAFFDNYISVGSFPEVEMSMKEIQIRLFKMIGEFATPVI